MCIQLTDYIPNQECVGIYEHEHECTWMPQSVKRGFISSGYYLCSYLPLDT